MIGRRINEALNLGGNHNLFRITGDFYQLLNDFPGNLIDLNGYIKFETLFEYEENEHLQRGERIHIPNGICNLPNYIHFTEVELFIVNQILDSDSVDQDSLDLDNQAERRPRNIDSIVRNQGFVREVKRLRDNTCQICGNKLEIGPNCYYSEVHHLQPLGNPHNGPDIKNNMICVCPNCHKKLDYGFLTINVILENLQDHIIDEQFIVYHNERT